MSGPNLQPENQNQIVFGNEKFTTHKEEQYPNQFDTSNQADFFTQDAARFKRNTQDNQELHLEDFTKESQNGLSLTEMNQVQHLIYKRQKPRQEQLSAEKEMEMSRDSNYLFGCLQQAKEDRGSVILNESDLQ